MKETVNVNINPDKIHLMNIRVLAANFYVAPTCIDTPIGGYNLEFKVDNGLNVQDKAIRIVIDGKFQATDENNKPIDAKCELSSEFIFVIDDMETYLIEEDEKTGLWVIHPSLGATVMGIAYSTYRGIVYARTQGNFKDPVILPVISPQKLLDEANSNPKD